MNTTQTTTAPAPRNRRRWLIAGAAAVALLAGAGTTHAWAQRHHQGGWSMDQGVPVERIERRVDRMLFEVDATADQKAKVHAIIEAAAKEIDPIRKSMSGTREQIRALLSAPQIDRAAVEAIRSRRIAAMDQISQHVTKAMEDAADVLTPEQRQKLATLDADRETHGAHHKR